MPFTSGSHCGARALASLLLLMCSASCNDAGEPAPSLHDAGAEAASEGGAAAAALDAQRESSDASDEIVTEAGPQGDEPSRPPISDGPCSLDRDCDDGLYCNGLERCMSKFPGSDVKLCMVPEHGPCEPSACDEATDSCDCSVPDSDMDGYKVEGCAAEGKPDCDDEDRNRHPGNPEICDVDHPMHDEDCSEESYSADADGDGYYDQQCGNRRRFQPRSATAEGPRVVMGSDCDDHDKSIHPGAEETCDHVDNNCNGTVDEVSGAPKGEATTYYRDRDGDFWGDDTSTLETLCNFAPAGYALQGGDCNDLDPKIAPGRGEVCNGVDDDCDTHVDEPLRPDTLLFGEPYDGVTRFECAGAAGWKIKQCPPGRLNCDDSYLDACETIGTSICNCHACGKSCSFSCGETDCEEIRAVGTGYTHTCAVVQSPSAPAGTGGTVSCWGSNATGQLGDGTTRNSPVAVQVKDVSGATAVALGVLHSCAITAEGSASCWGSNVYGQLGAAAPGTSSVYALPVAAPAEWGKAKQIASGEFYTCAIFGNGLLACWGLDDVGQLATGSDGAGLIHKSPVQARREVDGEQVFIEDATQVVTGLTHTCALSSGKVECWGDNSFGQLGEDPSVLSHATVARAVPGLEGFIAVQLAAGGGHTCARSLTEVRCWGNNEAGALANADVGRRAPTTIPLPPGVVSISAGLYFGCALSRNGTAMCWGSNNYGERGSADPPGILPTSISLPHITSIFGGSGQHICATTADLGTWCWGKNDFGQLGNGTLSELFQPTPKQVRASSAGSACSLSP